MKAHIAAMTKSYDIIIAGGGLNGATIALGAAKLGLSTLVIDANPDHSQMREHFDGRSYAMALTSVRLMRALGFGTSCPNMHNPC